MNYAEQIAAFEVKRASLVAANAAIMEKAANEGATLDESQKQDFDGNEADIAEIDDHLKRLRVMERSNANTASGVDGKSASGASDSRDTRIQVRSQAQLAPGIEFARAVKCFGMAKGAFGDAISIAKARYGENANVVKTLLTASETGLNNFQKAEVSAGANISGNWATELVGAETSAFADFVSFLRPTTILGKFGAGGIPSLRAVPFRVPLITQTSGGEGYWVGEGKPKPLTSFGFSRTTLEPLKVANIAVLTKELLRDSSPSAETLIRDELAAALRQRLDIDFIDPTKAVSAGVSPASITNGAETIVATGTGDADDIRLDVRSLMQKFIDADNPPSQGVWIMSSSMALSLSMMVNALGQPEFTGLGMAGGIFMGLPVITSEHVSNYVVLMNASDIYFADEGGISIDMSSEASLEMLDSSLQGSAVTDVNAVSMVSMFQTNSVAFLAERSLNWARRRVSAVAYLTSVAWGGAVVPS